MHGLLFDLGGTFLRAAVARSDGALYDCQKLRICSVAHGLEASEIWNRILESMLAYIDAQENYAPPDAPVVISFPGPIDKESEILQAPTVAGAGSPFNLPLAIRSATGRRVAVLNDVSAAAWQIARKTDARRFAVVTVSSGIGSKIFDRCHASGVLDQPPYAGEIGHVVVDDSRDAPICDCGGQGHLGAIASGRGIERMTRRMASSDPAAFNRSLLVTRFGATSADLTNERHIVPAVKASDPWASRIVYASTRPLVRALLTVGMAAGLEKIFFIGGFANVLGERYIEIVRELAFDLSRYEVARPFLDNFFEGVPTHEETSLEGCAAFLRVKGAGRWL